MPLRQLYPDPRNPVNRIFKVDIFAVHGLNPRSKNDSDHAWDTWRRPAGPKGRLWLRDDLPHSIPDARIFLYEYNATAVYGKDRSTFIDKANELLEAIRTERDEEDVPILFLAHSMGGLLVKQALINAYMNPKYKSIKQMTKGLAFFATPHHGGDGSLVSLGTVATKIARTAGFQRGDDVLETLKSGSMFSDIIQEHWRHQLMEYNIVSFWGALDDVVPRESARFGIPGDRENIVKLNASHGGVCKFGASQTDEDNFKLVRRNVQDIYESALQECARRPEDHSMSSQQALIPSKASDPLSLSASVTGLLGAAGQLSSTLQLLSSVRNSPNAVRDCRQEITHVELALRSFERYLRRLGTINPQRTMLIQLDDLIITLSDAMMTFSAFDDLLRRLETMTKARVAISWVKYSKHIEEHLARMQRLKTSLNMMLMIVQCDTDIEACETRDRLEVLIEEVLNDNKELKKKLHQLEDRFDARSTFTRETTDWRSVGSEDEDARSETSTIRDNGNSGGIRSSVRPLEFVGGISFAFEKILEQSRVYRMNQGTECDRSFLTSDAQSRTWSIFSGFSLADISVLSVIAMPINLVELSNGRYYDIEANPSENYTGAGKAGTSFDYLAENPDTQDDSSQNTVTVGDEASESQENELQDSDDDELDKVYACKGCGEILEEGKAFELGEHRWHLNCFRCSTCDELLDSDATILLLPDGSLICNNCTYSCNACGEKIEDLAILTGEQAFCSKCFCCRNCKQKIENLRYARTSQGIFCMPCHESLMARRRKKKIAKQGSPSIPADGHSSHQI